MNDLLARAVINNDSIFKLKMMNFVLKLMNSGGEQPGPEMGGAKDGAAALEHGLPAPHDRR